MLEGRDGAVVGLGKLLARKGNGEGKKPCRQSSKNKRMKGSPPCLCWVSGADADSIEAFSLCTGRQCRCF